MGVVDKPQIASTPEAITHNEPIRNQILRGLTLAAIVGFLVGVYLSLSYAGTDIQQGEVQRIFYIHVASFMGATIAFFTALVAGIAYLRTRNHKWDTLEIAGVEVGFALALVNLFTGMFWARPIWNSWWTWDPRLTSAAIMALTYAAYLMLRNGFENQEHRRTFSAVYSILAFATVVFTIMIIRIRPDTIHPTVVGDDNGGEGGFAMSGNMQTAFVGNIIIWSVLIAPALMWWRIRLENVLHNIEVMKARLIEN